MDKSEREKEVIYEVCKSWLHDQSYLFNRQQKEREKGFLTEGFFSVCVLEVLAVLAGVLGVGWVGQGSGQKTCQSSSSIPAGLMSVSSTVMKQIQTSALSTWEV